MTLDDLEWDKPTLLYQATNSYIEDKHYAQLVRRHVLGCLTLKDGYVTKHSLCFTNIKGVVVVLYMGDVVYTSGATRLKFMTPRSIYNINEILKPHGLTFKDIKQ